MRARHLRKIPRISFKTVQPVFLETKKDVSRSKYVIRLFYELLLLLVLVIGSLVPPFFSSLDLNYAPLSKGVRNKLAAFPPLNLLALGPPCQLNKYQRYLATYGR